MRFTTPELELFEKVDFNFPQLRYMLKNKLEEELTNLLNTGNETIQVHQGRCQLLKELLVHLDSEAANRPAKRTVTQPFSQ